MLSWNLTKLLKFHQFGHLFKACFLVFCEACFLVSTGGDPTLKENSLETRLIIWISINWKLDYLDFNSDGHMISLTINVCVK